MKTDAMIMGARPPANAAESRRRGTDSAGPAPAANATGVRGRRSFLGFHGASERPGFFRALRRRSLAAALILAAFPPAAVWAEGASGAPAASGVADEGRFFRVYALGFVEIGIAEAAARAIVGEGGTVVPDRRQQRLLVRATETEHRRLAETLAALNRPPPNVRIEVEIEDDADDRRRGAAISGGGVFGPGGAEIAIGLSAEDRATRSRERVRQTLLVASGREALLRVGERVPYLSWIDAWGRRAGAFATAVEWQDVGAFLAVEPTVIGDGPMIRIRLVPELSGRVAGRPHRIRFAAAATEIVARAGEPVSLGGLARDHEFYSRFLVGADAGGGGRSLRITLTPTLLAPPAPPPR